MAPDGAVFFVSSVRVVRFGPQVRVISTSLWRSSGSTLPLMQTISEVLCFREAGCDMLEVVKIIVNVGCIVKMTPR